MSFSSVLESSIYRLALAAIVALALGAATRAQATDYLMSETADGFTGDGICTLREALYAAGNNMSFDTCQAGSTDLDTITLTTIGGTYLFNTGQHLIASGNGPAAKLIAGSPRIAR
jgi:hypothetical protein